MVIFCLLPECLEEIILFNAFVKKPQNKQSTFGKSCTTAGLQLTFPGCIFSGINRISMGGLWGAGEEKRTSRVTAPLLEKLNAQGAHNQIFIALWATNTPWDKTTKQSRAQVFFLLSPYPFLSPYRSSECLLHCQHCYCQSHCKLVKWGMLFNAFLWISQLIPIQILCSF